MENDSQKQGLIDRFLSSLKNDIETKNVTFVVAFKWVVLLYLAYILFPFTVIVFLWLIWSKTGWATDKRAIATVMVVIASGWLSFFGSSVEQIEQPIAQSQQKTEAQQTQLPIQQEVAPADIAEAPKELYTVVSVTDGDTLKVDINGTTETLRLIGIDTPETVDPRKPVQCFGEEASKKAKETLAGKKVSLEADATQGERDKYQRLLRYVYLEDGISFNKWMIEEGYAHEYTYQSNPYKYQASFQEAERQAREGKRGLWSDDTCSGDTTQAAAVGVAIGSTLLSDDASSAPVKKSTTGICHAPGTTYYARTKNYTPYDTLDECLKSGGRLPKR